MALAVIAMIGIGVALVAGTVVHTIDLYRAERLPAAK